MVSILYPRCPSLLGAGVTEGQGRRLLRQRESGLGELFPAVPLIHSCPRTVMAVSINIGDSE